jgi:ubiquinone/menaquinone biosynthesis C-methylase UbiE
MDASTEELQDVHDELAEWYAKNLVGLLESRPVERAVLDLFAEMTLAVAVEVADVGCGTGRLLPYLASRGLSPRGVDLSPGMVEVARREHPGFAYEVADLRELPFEAASLVGVVCWFSLIFLAPGAKARAFAEFARVVKPDGYLVTSDPRGNEDGHRMIVCALWTQHQTLRSPRAQRRACSVATNYRPRDRLVRRPVLPGRAPPSGGRVRRWAVGRIGGQDLLAGG